MFFFYSQLKWTRVKAKVVFFALQNKTRDKRDEKDERETRENKRERE